MTNSHKIPEIVARLRELAPDSEGIEHACQLLEAIYEGRQSRRDRFAAAALTGLLAKYGDDHYMGRDGSSKGTAARLSVEFADALIAELDKP